MSTVWILQHVACETPGIIAGVLKSQGLSAQTIRPFRSQPVPKRMGDTVGLIVMGGPMGVYDQRSYPFLLDEMRLIEDALKQGKPILGVCLGSQLLAAAVGAKVTKGERKEIGWYPVTLTGSARTDRLWKGVEPSFVAYHWHGDIFELPRGALSLASSDLTECQGFRFGQSAYGFLFHMEVARSIIKNMVETFSEELRDAGIRGRDLVRKAEDYLPRLQRIGRLVFQRWAGLVRQ